MHISFAFLLKFNVFFVYLCIFALLALLGNQFFLWINPESQPPTDPWGFERVKVGGCRRLISFGKRDVFFSPFFYQFKMLGTFEKKKTQMFFLWMIFRLIFLMLCGLSLFFLVGILCTFTMLVMAVWEAELWENEGLIGGYQTICWASILLNHYSQIWKGPNSNDEHTPQIFKDTRGRCTSAQSHRIHGTGVSTCIYHKTQPNVGKHRIHGSYGNG